MKVVTLPLCDTTITEQEIYDCRLILNTFRESFPHLSGFGGDCFAAAHAINEVVFSNKAKIIGCVNKAVFENTNNSIGHVFVHCLTDDHGSMFVDIEGFKKSDDVEHWAMLDSEDIDYQELFEENNIDINDDNFNDSLYVEYTSDDIREIVIEEKIKGYYDALTFCKNNLTSLNLTVKKSKNKFC